MLLLLKLIFPAEEEGNCIQNYTEYILCWEKKKSDLFFNVELIT